MSDATADDSIAGGSPPLDEEALEDYVLATRPEFVEAMHEANDDLKAGATRSLTDILKELGAADSGSGS